MKEFKARFDEGKMSMKRALPILFFVATLTIIVIFLMTLRADGATLKASTTVCLTPTFMRDMVTLINEEDFESAEGMVREGKCVKNYEPISAVVLDELGDYRKIRFKQGEEYYTGWTFLPFLDE